MFNLKSIGKCREFFNSYVGLKQGDSLSPLLCFLFLNDISFELSIEGNDALDNGIFLKFMPLFADYVVLGYSILQERSLNLLKKK